MTPNQCMVSALQYAGVGSAQNVPKETIVRLMNSEAQIVASMFPILIQEDITTDSNGQFDLSGLTDPMAVVDVFDSDGNKLTRESA